MKSYKEFINETSFADLNPRKGTWERVPVSMMKKAQREPPENIDTELFDLIATSYSYIGGHVDFQKPSDIPANHTIWYAVDTDGDGAPDALKFAKQTPHGTKWTGGATDGSLEAISEYIHNTVDALMTPGNYCEMSDKIMHIMITRYKVPCVQSQDEVENILGKKVKWIGSHPDGKYRNYNGFYVRSLGGQDHMKILLGKPR